MTKASEIDRAAHELNAAILQYDAMSDEKSRAAVKNARATFETLVNRTSAGRAREGANLERSRPRVSEPMGARSTQLEASVSLHMASIATSMVHVWARHGQPLVTVQVKNLRTKIARVTVRCHVEGYSATAVKTIEIDSQGTGTYQVFPTFFPERIRTLTESVVASLHVEVIDLDGKTETVQSHPIALLPPTTAVLFQRDAASGEYADLTRYLAAWVTPNAPIVQSTLRASADFAPSKMLLGQQSGVGPGDIRSQVGAIYNALKAAAIVYINSPLAYGGSATQIIQRVRLPRESLENRAANCLDGTVLMASLLEAVALPAAIVLVPGHAYLAFKPKPEADEWEYVETTMIGSEPFERACEQGKQVTAKWKAADQLHLVDISQVRDGGIMPME